jgi:hypothetical protein
MNSWADSLSKALTEVCDKYSEVVDKTLSEAAQDALHSLETNPNIPNGARRRTGKRKGKKYKESFWIYEEQRGFRKTYTVANKQYQLTHLLERGHLTRNGMSRTRAFPHWKEAETWAQKLPERLKKELSNI